MSKKNTFKWWYINVPKIIVKLNVLVWICVVLDCSCDGRQVTEWMDSHNQVEYMYMTFRDVRPSLAMTSPLTSLRIFFIIHVWRHGELWCHIWPYFAIVKNSLKFLTPDLDHLKPATGRPSVPAFPCQRLRAFVCVLSELIHGDAKATMCVYDFDNNVCVRKNVSCSSSACSTHILRSVAGYRGSEYACVQALRVDRKGSDCSIESAA